MIVKIDLYGYFLWIYYLNCICSCRLFAILLSTYRKVFYNKSVKSILKKNACSLTIIPSSQHSISNRKINKNALKVLNRLNRSGHEAYLVGGSVRDLLLDREPKDFDIATNAKPEQVRKLFRNCRLIGRRFRLAHIIFGSEIIEVATFRGHHQCLDQRKINATTGRDGILLRDNIFGTIEEDAQRRDFSLNSLYYSAYDSTLRDYTGGLRDLRKGTIRMIGNPEIRYREDPVRILRAIRFAVKLNMTISYATSAPIPRLAALLQGVPPARLYEEALKLLYSGYGEATYRMLCKHKILNLLFPLIKKTTTKHNSSCAERMIINVLANTDRCLNNRTQVNPALLFASILWYPLMLRIHKLIKTTKISYLRAFSIAKNDVINEQCRTIAIPRRLIVTIQDIWQIQLQMSLNQGKYNYKLSDYPKFELPMIC